MAAGSYSKPVSFFAPSTSIDAFGQRSTTLGTATIIAARVRAMSPREVITSGLESSQRGVMVVVRYSPMTAGFNSGYKMRIDGVLYDIEAVDALGFDNKEIQFVGREVR